MGIQRAGLAVAMAWAVAFAASGRTWTSASGKQLEAEFVELQGGQAVLKKPDGTLVRIAPDRLGAADQEYLKSRQPDKPAAGPAAGATEVPTPAEPTLTPGFVGRPEFDTRSGEIRAGTCFLIEFKGQTGPLLLTAQHLFGAAGGLDHEVPHDQMPSFARRAAFEDLLKGGRQSSAVEGLRIPDGLDLAAFRTSLRGKVAPRPLAAQNPQKGDPIWLAARLQGQPEDQLLHRGVVVELFPDLIKCKFDEGDLVTRGASGAPYLNARGEVVGLHTGSFKTPGQAAGSLLPAVNLRQALESGLAK